MENVIWGTAELLRLDYALRWATPRLEEGLARATGDAACSDERAAGARHGPNAGLRPQQGHHKSVLSAGMAAFSASHCIAMMALLICRTVARPV